MTLYDLKETKSVTKSRVHSIDIKTNKFWSRDIRKVEEGIGIAGDIFSILKKSCMYVCM